MSSFSAGGTAEPVKELLAFIQSKGIKVLNVAGSRASKEPGIGNFVKEVLSLVVLVPGRLQRASALQRSRLSAARPQELQ